MFLARNFTVFSLAAGLGLAFVAAPADAIPLLPGSTIPATPTPIDPQAAGTFIDVRFENFTAATFSGQLGSTVWQESLADNPLGGLTFVYGVGNDATSEDPIDRITFTSFAGFLVNASVFVEDVNDPFPAAFTRSVNGAIVGVDYDEPDAVYPGEFGRFIVLRTNAPAYTDGTANLIDGSVTSAPTFVPIPEPATLSLLGLGGLALMRRRR